jgi:hypothetical protein
MTLIGSPEDAGGVSVTPKKHRGRIAASPMFLTKMFGRAYLFFFLAAFFFAAILFSSQVSDSSARFIGGARIQFTCIVIDGYLVKRKVNDEEKK